MKIKSMLLVLCLLSGLVYSALANPSGASLKTTLQKQIVGECDCPALVLSAEVAPHYSYKIQTTTNLNQPEWIDKPGGPVTSLDTNMSWAMPLTSIGNSFFRVVELGEGPYVGVSLNSASPAPSTIHISTATTTHNVPLIVYDLKSHLTNGTLRSLMIQVIATSPTNDFSYVFAGIKLNAFGLTYYGNVVSTSGRSDYLGGCYGWKVQFDNMTIPLPADVSVPLALRVDFARDTNNALDGIQVLAGETGLNYVNIEDSNYNPMAVEAGPVGGTLFTITGVSEF